MCIIAIKKKNVKFPEVSTIKSMCDNNPDGFAIVYHITGKGVSVMRSLDSADVYKTYRNLLRYSYKKVSFFMHARIKTHGTININNCHGWKSDECRLWFAHNGILKIDNRDDMTDSETYLRDIFTPAYLYGGWKAAERTINACIGTSKFVFMNEDGHIKHYGNYIDDGGMLYSNNTYKEDRWSSYYNYKPYSSYHSSAIKFKKGDIVYSDVDIYTNLNIKIAKNAILTVGTVYDYGFYATDENGKMIWIGRADVEKLKLYIPKTTKSDSKKTDKTIRINDIVKCTHYTIDATGIEVCVGTKWVVEAYYDELVELTSIDECDLAYIDCAKFMQNFEKSSIKVG